MISQESFLEALRAPRHSPEIPPTHDLYGWLIGSWELDVLCYGVDVRDRKIKGEAHFSWVLEGRAVQDLWIMPRLSDRTTQIDLICNSFGTTLRVWDPNLQAWRITWINPVTGRRDELVGRRSGQDIVQIGTHSNGIPIRWIFSDITPEGFLWTGEALEPDGQTWKLEGQFRARRMT